MLRMEPSADQPGDKWDVPCKHWMPARPARPVLEVGTYEGINYRDLRRSRASRFRSGLEKTASRADDFLLYAVVLSTPPRPPHPRRF